MSRANSKPLHWEPIKDLPENWRDLASPELASLAAVWRERYEVLKDTPDLKEFNERLARKWAIETGIIENLYTLDRGTTETLIEHGIRADLIRDNDSDAPAEYVVALVSDQQSALDSIFDFVKGERKITTSYIKELHAVFTKHQPTTKAVDQFGNIQDVTLIRGDWKKHPNNPSRNDGSVAHFYAPPEHTAAEMDRLIEMHQEHMELGVAPEVEAAWLHHRFAQIHPFQDGNGRVARTLASIVLIKAGLFPIVIQRDTRSQYISALEMADEGELSPLANLFMQFQKDSILIALKVETGLKANKSNVEEILRAAKDKLKDSPISQPQEFNRVLILSKHLENIALSEIRSIASKIKDILPSPIESENNVVVEYKGNNEGGWRTMSGKQPSGVLTRYPSESEYRAIMRLLITTATQSSIELYYQAIGTTLTGAMEVFAHHYNHTLIKSGDLIKGSHLLSKSPFTFTYQDNITELEPRFKKWLDEVILFGLDEWRRQL